MKNAFGLILKKWRKQRRYSQLQLSVDIDISSKHISFLETGRSKASRQMIIKLGTFLKVSKSEINNALLAAGFAPVFSHFDRPEIELKPVFDAMELMLNNHMPYPAIVLDKDWDIVNVNQTAMHMMSEIGFAHQINLIQALIDDDPEKSKIVNWHYTVAHLLLRIKNEMAIFGATERLIQLQEQLSGKITTTDELKALENQQPVLASEIMLNNEVYSFFSIIANLGAVQDINVSEYKVELMFPNDDKTTAYFKS